MTELALDDDQRHAFASHLNRMGVSELVLQAALPAGPRFGVDGASGGSCACTVPEAQLTTAVERLSVAWRSVADDVPARTVEPPALVA